MSPLSGDLPSSSIMHSQILRKIIYLMKIITNSSSDGEVNDDEMIFKHLDSLQVEDFKDVKSEYSITFDEFYIGLKQKRERKDNNDD
ncbi:hypothetical protein QJS10_CPA08g00474 [Acorus calamus]|uniref:Uncharacterized protein n=1 Tax=Acorus calamus TaxID=4465 RepID=A0AAV9E974_ACOCL|nr:hypothetical protein QJS10_CPA08g00474 [Acorus calamus]